jgi:low affinity Fe/Cu permease
LVAILGPKKFSAHWALLPNIAVLVEEGKMVFFFRKTQLLSTPRKDAYTSTSKEARSFDIFKPQ